MTQQEIKHQLNVRLKLLQDGNEVEADKIEAVIIEVLKIAFVAYPVDFIIETLTHFGQAPNVLYDDDGRFAVSSAGYQPVPVDGPTEGAFTVFVKREQWQPTIREALWDYLTRRD